MSDQPNINKAEEPGADASLSPESNTRAAMTLPDALAASLSGDLSSDADPADEVTLSEEELAGLSSQGAERGIDLGSLLGTVIAASSQTKPKPAAAQTAAGKKEDPAALLGKLAESLGISPAELMKRLGPVLKEMLSGQGVKPKKPAAKPKPKPKTTAKPAAKPKPKPKTTTKPAAKPKPKPKTTTKPAAKPKPATTTKPAVKPKPKPKTTTKPAVKPKPTTTTKPKPKPKKASKSEPITQ